MKDKFQISREVQKALSRGQIDRAISLWEDYVSDNPDARIFNTLGDLYLRKGVPERAIEYFHKAAERFRADGFVTQAQAIYKKILNIKPSEARALILTGDLYRERGLINEAVKFYLGAIETYAKEGKNTELSEVCEKIIELAPDNLSLRTKLANYLHKEGFLKEASKEYLNVGMLSNKRGDADTAVQFLEKAIEIYPRNEEAYEVLYHFYKENEMYERAEEVLTKGLELFPDNLLLRLRKAEVLLMQDRTAEAKALLEPILEQETVSDLYDSASELMIEIHLKEGNRTEAIERLNDLCERYKAKEKTDEAISLCQKYRHLDVEGITRTLIELHRQRGDTIGLSEELMKLAETLVSSGKKEEAIKLYEEALQYRPSDEELLQRLRELSPEPPEVEPPVEKVEREKTFDEKMVDVDIFLRYGLTDEAIDLLEKMKVEDPENIEVHKRLKDLYIEANDKERAIAECLALYQLYDRLGMSEQKEAVLNEAFQIDPADPRLPQFMHETETVSEREEEFVGTELKGFEKAEGVEEEYAEQLSEAEFYYRQGLLEDALQLYQRLVEVNPEDEFLKNRITEIQKALKKEVSPETSQESPPEEIEDIEEIKAVVEDDVASPEPLLDTDVMEIFEEFKKGIAEEIEEEDYETHYNLGIAYKEMGLIDDAIKEFQIAKKDPQRKVQVLSILGLCYMEKGLYSLAIDALNEAIKEVKDRDEGYWSMKYDLATAYEKNGDIKKALDLFVEVYGWDSKFRGVDEKVNNLKAMLEMEVQEKEPEKKEQKKPPTKKDRISYI